MRPKKTLIDKLLAGDDYIIIGHVAPDGDAVGSCMAMMLALEQLGKRAFVCLADGMPKMFESFPFAERVITPDRPLPFVPKTGLAVDVSEKYRMGTAEPLYDACGTKLMIDHHGTNTGFGDEWWIDGEAAAVGEMLTALIEEMGVTIDKNIATWLYISIFTDCGRFGYSNTRPETHLAAAKLVAAGVDVAKLTNKIFLEQSVARTKLQGAVLSTIRTTADGRIAWAKLTEQMLADTGALREDDDGISSTLVQMRGVEVAFLAKEFNGATKFSVRSKAVVDVANHVTKPLGGGGHARAAGVTLQQPIDAAIDVMLTKCISALNESETQA